MNWRLLVAFSVAIIGGALFSSYLPDLHGSQTELSRTDKISISKGTVFSGAAASGFISGGGLLSNAEAVEFAQPAEHDVKLDIPPVFKCNPFDHVRLGIVSLGATTSARTVLLLMVFRGAILSSKP